MPLNKVNLIHLYINLQHKKITKIKRPLIGKTKTKCYLSTKHLQMVL